MEAGRRRHLITLQHRVANQDSLGTNDYTFADLPTNPQEWAEALPLRGREFFAAGEMQSEITVKFSFPFRADLDDTMRVLWDGVPYDIASPPINVDGRSVDLELMCKNGVRDGR